jgi:RNA polymerase-binding transcription factor DksA
MSDAADVANDYVDRLIDTGIKNARSQINSESQNKLSEAVEDCVECGAPIPEKRRELTGSDLCVHCKEVLEIQRPIFTK